MTTILNYYYMGEFYVEDVNDILPQQNVQVEVSVSPVRKTIQVCRIMYLLDGLNDIL